MPRIEIRGANVRRDLRDITLDHDDALHRWQYRFVIEALKDDIKALLDAMATQNSIRKGADPPQQEKDSSSTDMDPATLLNIIKRFHLAALQLRQRHENRPTLTVEDEYDVQDLLHALLQLDFDDIRREEWTPSYAGGASRMDFRLKQEQVVIETKKTRKGLGDKEVGQQLIVDIAK